MPPVRSNRDADELEVYALSTGNLPPRIQVGALSLRVLFVGPVAVIAGASRRSSTDVEDALRRQHAIVLALAEQIDPLLPARFGSRVTASRLDATIRPAVRIVTRALENVRGRQQMTVRLVGPPGAEAPPPVITSGTAYLTHRRAVARAVPPEAAPLLAAAAPFVIEQRVQPGRGGLRATLFHLVRREHIRGYRRAVNAALPAMKPWSAAVSGPWPPFAFAPDLIG